VLISSDPDVTTPAEARAAGAIDFLSKTDLPTGILRRLLTGSD
jgi:FixJ family two-component response regulator